MRKTSTRIGLLTRTAVALALVAVAGAGSPALSHLELEKSTPSANEALSESPSAVILWFTQAPQMSGTSVRVLPQDGEPLDLGDATAKENDATVVVLDVDRRLPDGAYRVMWRAMAHDGHTVRGDFAFTIEGAEPWGTGSATARSR